VYPRVVEPEAFNYVIEWGEVGGAACQLRTEGGQIVSFEAGQPRPTDEVDFALWAKREIWHKAASGELDAVAAIAAKRIDFRRGPVAEAIRQAPGLKAFVKGFGTIPTAW
jgi:putative sterol carrier protein